MEILSVALIIAGGVLLMWFFASVVIATGMIQTGKYRRVSVPMVPLVGGGLLLFAGLTIWLVAT